MKDPLIYQLLAVGNLVVWFAFVLNYGGGLIARHTRVGAFAGALLGVGYALVIYSIASVLKQFLGDFYEGRDAVRIIASAGLLIAGAVINYVVWRERRRRR